MGDDGPKRVEVEQRENVLDVEMAAGDGDTTQTLPDEENVLVMGT